LPPDEDEDPPLPPLLWLRRPLELLLPAGLCDWEPVPLSGMVVPPP
jgi:hypothetical protein